jgi:hypothetical protein
MKSVEPQKVEQPKHSALYGLAGSDANMLFFLFSVWRIRSSDFPDAKQIVRFRFLTLSLIPVLFGTAIVAEVTGLTWLPQGVASVYCLAVSHVMLTVPSNGFIFTAFNGDVVQRRRGRCLVVAAVCSGMALFLFFSPTSGMWDIITSLFAAFASIAIASAIGRGIRLA